MNGGQLTRFGVAREVRPVLPRSHEHVVLEQRGHRDRRVLGREPRAHVDGFAIGVFPQAGRFTCAHGNQAGGGQPVRNSNDGRDVQNHAHALGQDPQRRLRGLPVRGVVHEVAVDVKHIPRAHRLYEVSPRARGRHRLRALRGDEGALCRPRDQRHTETVVDSPDARAGVDDSFAREGVRDQRGMGALANRAEGHGLGPHAPRCHEGVESTTHVRAGVARMLISSAMYRAGPLQDPVHEDLPHEDDAARPGSGGRGGGRLLGDSVLARNLGGGSRVGVRAWGHLIAQRQQIRSDGAQVEA